MVTFVYAHFRGWSVIDPALAMYRDEMRRIERDLAARNLRKADRETLQHRLWRFAEVVRRLEHQEDDRHVRELRRLNRD